MKKIMPAKKLKVPDKPIPFSGDVPVDGKTWKKLGQIATRYQVSKRTDRILEIRRNFAVLPEGSGGPL